MNVKEPIALVWKKLLQMHIGECFCALCYISDFCIAVAKVIVKFIGEIKPWLKTAAKAAQQCECL